MGPNFKIRIIIDIFIILSIVTCPWWLTFLLVILGLFLFNKFYEAFLFGLILDSLYGISREVFLGKNYISILIVVVLFFLVNWLKKRLRIYSN